MGQTQRSRSQGKNRWYPQKGLITGKIHVIYQSSSTHCLKDISKVKVFKKWVKLQGQGHRVTKYLYTRKGLITGNIYVKYQRSRAHCSKVIFNLRSRGIKTHINTSQQYNSCKAMMKSRYVECARSMNTQSEM